MAASDKRFHASIDSGYVDDGDDDFTTQLPRSPQGQLKLIYSSDSARQQPPYPNRLPAPTNPVPNARPGLNNSSPSWIPSDQNRTPPYGPEKYQGPEISREQKWWNAYNTDPNVSGINHGQVVYRNPAPNHHPGPSKNWQGGIHSAFQDQPVSHSPIAALSPPDYRYFGGPQHHAPTYHSATSSPVNPDIPPISYQSFPSYHPTHPQAAAIYGSGPEQYASPNNTHATPGNPYIPMTDPYVPPASSYAPFGGPYVPSMPPVHPQQFSTYPQPPSSYPNFPHPSPYQSDLPPSPYSSQPYTPTAHPYQDAAQGGHRFPPAPRVRRRPPIVPSSNQPRKVPPTSMRPPGSISDDNLSQEDSIKDSQSEQSFSDDDWSSDDDLTQVGTRGNTGARDKNGIYSEPRGGYSTKGQSKSILSRGDSPPAGFQSKKVQKIMKAQKTIHISSPYLESHYDGSQSQQTLLEENPPYDNVPNDTLSRQSRPSSSQSRESSLRRSECLESTNELRKSDLPKTSAQSERSISTESSTRPDHRTSLPTSQPSKPFVADNQCQRDIKNDEQSHLTAPEDVQAIESSEEDEAQNHDTNEESEISSSDEEEEWSESPYQSPTEETDAIQILLDAPSTGLSFDSPIDNDLLDPFGWAQKMSATEGMIKQSHENRKVLPNTIDSKTCPKLLTDFWTEIEDVDKILAHLERNLDKSLTMSKKHIPKQSSTLLELLEAFQFRETAKQLTRTTSLQSTSKASTFPFEIAEVTSMYQAISRLAKARDYLMSVCKDGECLKELHPSMDAILWLQHLPQEIGKIGRPTIIELKSLELSQLASVIMALNVLLQMILWGWDDQSSSFFDTRKVQTRSEHRDSSQNDVGLCFVEALFDSEAFSTGSPFDGARIIAKHVGDNGFGSLIEGLEDFAAMLSQALILQCDAHIAPQDPLKEIAISYGAKLIQHTAWVPCALACMGDFIQNRQVWLLTQCCGDKASSRDDPPGKAFLKTRICDLAKIWGPIWKVSGIEDQHNGIWYRLPGGYIGQRLEPHLPPESGEFPCHFSTERHDFGPCPNPHATIPDEMCYLLIGHSLPTGLSFREACKIPFELGLQDFERHLVGTSPPSRYKDSDTLHLGLNQVGAQASWSMQMKLNPGILAKEALLQRWKEDPSMRNPIGLLLWYGLEFSICTRNAKRCRVIDLLRSDVIIDYLEFICNATLKKDYMLATFAALKSSEPYDLVNLYLKHEEWRIELGKIIAHCLELLNGTGIDKAGNLAAFVFSRDLNLTEQLIIIPTKGCTWTGLLKDSSEMATLVVVSTRCLEYPGNFGQKCRGRARRLAKSVLETSYSLTKPSLDLRRTFKRMQANDRLKMQISGKFKIKKCSSRGILLGTWDPWRYMVVPSSYKNFFREKRLDGEPAFRVFVLSKRKQQLARLRLVQAPESLTRSTSSEVVPITLSKDDQSERTRVPALASYEPVPASSDARDKAAESSLLATSPTLTLFPNSSDTGTFTQISQVDHISLPTKSSPAHQQPPRVVDASTLVQNFHPSHPPGSTNSMPKLLAIAGGLTPNPQADQPQVGNSSTSTQSMLPPLQDQLVTSAPFTSLSCGVDASTWVEDPQAPRVSPQTGHDAAPSQPSPTFPASSPTTGDTLTFNETSQADHSIPPTNNKPAPQYLPMRVDKAVQTDLDSPLSSHFSYEQPSTNSPDSQIQPPRPASQRKPKNLPKLMTSHRKHSTRSSLPSPAPSSSPNPSSSKHRHQRTRTPSSSSPSQRKQRDPIRALVLHQDPHKEPELSSPQKSGEVAKASPREHLHPRRRSELRESDRGGGEEDESARPKRPSRRSRPQSDTAIIEPARAQGWRGAIARSFGYQAVRLE